uniref:KID domain-containing protein n=1 Tax=Caenorhabditis tropicalis TaxID=1561998 RepID=A0A1I7T393_9PELO
MATMTSSPVAGSPLMMLLFKVPTSNTALQEGGDSEDEARRRREQLNRRPSYRLVPFFFSSLFYKECRS